MRNLLVLMPVILVSGCIPAAIVGTHQVGTSIAEERSIGDIVDDGSIATKVRASFFGEHASNFFGNITVTVKESRVMLTGSVKDESIKDRASEIAWGVRGVKEVINELIKSEKPISASAQDIWIANTIRAKLLLQKELKSVNYAVDVNEGVVYVLGIATDQSELDTALSIASQVKGVQKVQSHVILCNDPRRNIRS